MRWESLLDAVFRDLLTKVNGLLPTRVFILDSVCAHAQLTSLVKITKYVIFLINHGNQGKGIVILHNGAATTGTIATYVPA